MVTRNALIVVTFCALVSMSHSWLSRLNKASIKFRNNLHRRSGQVRTMSDYEQRFANVARLYTSESNPMSDILERLQGTHVCVIGLGGVGSWVAESLARSGIGQLTLIDMDDVCISNTNRQVMAQTSTVGKFKADCLKSRILDINPSAEVNTLLEFVRPDNAATFLATTHTPDTAVQGRYDYVIDAVDSSTDKAAIIDACVRSGSPVVTCGGVGGLVDPTLLTVSDLAQAEGDSLLYRVRRTLRREYGYPSYKEKQDMETAAEVGEGDNTNRKNNSRNKVQRVRKWGILAVHTLPTGVARTPVRSQQSEGSRSNPDHSQSDEGEQGPEVCSVSSESSGGGGGSFRTCDVSLGNACFVTGAVGMLMSSCVINAVGWGPAVSSVGVSSSVAAPAQSHSSGKVALRPRQLGSYFAAGASGEKADVSNTSQPVPSSANDTDAVQQSEEGGDCSCGKQSAALTSEVCLESVESIAHQRQQQEQNIHTLISTCMTDTPLVPMFDAHCHLQLPPLCTHSSAAVALASSYNISRVSVCGTAPGEDWKRVRTLYETHPASVLPSFGLHPWYINTHLTTTESSKSQPEPDSHIQLHSQSHNVSWEAQLESLLLQIPSAGVGECGLDKPNKTGVDSSVQEQILRAHIALAAKHQRVLTLHCVSGCWDRLLQILTEQQQKYGAAVKARPRSAIILHSCNSLPAHLAPHFARLHNTYFSLSMSGAGAGVTDKVVALVRSIPPQRLLLETDSPDQLPTQLRRRNTGRAYAVASGVTAIAEAEGDSIVSTQLQYNEPALVQYHCKKLSEALGVSYAQLAAQTYENTCRAFGISA